MGKTVLSLSCLFLLASCQLAQMTLPPTELIRRSVDLILTNGKIVTVDAAFTIANTLVVDNGRIVEVGDAAIAAKYQATSLVDLQGKTLLPGFIDSHIHISGDPLRYVNLTKVTSVVQMQDLIRAKAIELGKGEWITGYGWSVC